MKERSDWHLSWELSLLLYSTQTQSLTASMGARLAHASGRYSWLRQFCFDRRRKPGRLLISVEPHSKSIVVATCLRYLEARGGVPAIGRSYLPRLHEREMSPSGEIA